MKNIKKSKKRNEQKKRKNEKIKSKKKDKKTGEKKSRKKRKRGPKGVPPEMGPKIFVFSTRNAKRHRNEIEAQKKSDIEHPTKTKKMKENDRK